MRYALSLALALALSYPGLGYGEKTTNSTQKQSANEGPVRLESVFVGDKEQPAVSYFIPWQSVGTPDKLHWNMESKHDDELKMVDRDVMLRSIQLYDDMQLEAP